jgi:hypothetical protein
MLFDVRKHKDDTTRTIDADPFSYFWKDQTKEALYRNQSYNNMEDALRRIEAKAKGIFLDQKKNGQVMDISA